jgi:hypothetical protein
VTASREFGRQAIAKYHLARAGATAKALEAKGYRAIVAASAEEAATRILEIVPADALVGVGGSVTVRQIGVIEELEKRGNRVVHHWLPGAGKEEVEAARRAELTCDVFLTSVNALTIGGELVNIDGHGNRVAASIYGPGEVVFVAGANKIADDLDAALYRAKAVAAPVNAMRLGTRTPCAVTGVCVDCDAPTRICNVTVIFDRRPSGTPMTVVLVAEDLGY